MAAMRLTLLILLLVNVFLLIWGQGHLGARDEGREPGRMAQQLAPEKLRIVPPAPTPAAVPATP